MSRPACTSQPYRLDGATLEIKDGLSLMLRPRYEGRDADGNRVVDERITLSLVDSLHRQWPVLVKMGAVAARALCDGLRSALGG